MAQTPAHSHPTHHLDKDSKQSGGGGLDTSQHGRNLEDDVLPEASAEAAQEPSEDRQGGGGGLESNQHGRDLEDKEGHAGPQDHAQHRHH